MSDELIPVTSLPTTKEAPFKRLKMSHRRVVSLHVQGYAVSAIDRMLNKSSGFASGVLRNPTVQPLLESIYKDYDRELRGLFPLTVEAMRDALDKESDLNDRLRATEMWHKINGTYNKQPEDRTAEDIIETILERVQEDGTKVTVKRRVASHLLDVQKLDTEDDKDSNTIDVVATPAANS